MPKFIVEQDTILTETRYFAVIAPTLEEAIDATTEMEPDRIRVSPAETCSFDDSHEATKKEWDALTGWSHVWLDHT